MLKVYIITEDCYQSFLKVYSSLELAKAYLIRYASFVGSGHAEDDLVFEHVCGKHEEGLNSWILVRRDGRYIKTLEIREEGVD